jgi:ATP-dependent helicase HrpB
MNESSNKSLSDKLLAIFVSSNLPISNQLDNICSHIKQNLNLVLQAEPGAGKTTLVPLALLNCIANDKKILVLEPRRLAAKNAAQRMASLLKEPVGQTVGYRIRDESKTSAITKIEVITEGILIRMLQSDPELLNIGLVIFDEFHERSLDSDLGLALSLEVQQNLRDDLKLLIMSATLDRASISSLLGNAPIIQVEGRSYPISTQYIAPSKNKDWFQCINIALLKAIETCNHDILVFLPGVAEINKATRNIESNFVDNLHIIVIPLYGDLPFSQQQQALEPIPNKRKIILTTNIAETSVTIEGVDCVIDSGFLRQSVFDPNVGFDRLITKRVSIASATQRSGRAGRLGPGTCFRLWQESEFLRAETVPEILRADLAPFVLELAQWGVSHFDDISLLDKPNDGAYEQAKSLLVSLSALDANYKITQHGKNILALGIHPRIAHMLIKSVELNCINLACLISAMLGEKDILQGEARYNPDFQQRVQVVFSSDRNNKKYQAIFLQAKRLKNKLNALNLNPLAKGLSNNTRREPDYGPEINLAPVLLALVFPDRIAKKRGEGYQLANGSGVQVEPGFSLDSEFLVVIKQGGSARTTKIYQAIEISQTELEAYFSENMLDTHDIDWDNRTGSVRGQVNTKLGQLIFRSKPLGNIPTDKLLLGLIQGIEIKGIKCLPWTEELKQWQARVMLLKQTEEYNTLFPDVSDNNLGGTLSTWIGPYLNGLSRFSQIDTSVLSQSLKNCLDWKLQTMLDELAPTAIVVASGSKIKIDYLQGDKPVLAVKLQEMFGEKKSPRIANGLISIVTHLLSPAKRPLQITEDLAAFWANGYQEVKKEMKGRYPKLPHNIVVDSTSYNILLLTKLLWGFIHCIRMRDLESAY